MILIIDNYDSFTYNLVQAFGEFGEAMEIFRNDDVERLANCSSLREAKDAFCPLVPKPNHTLWVRIDDGICCILHEDAAEPIEIETHEFAS